MYSVEFLKEAAEEFRRIDPVWQKRVLQKIIILSEDPDILVNNIKKLQGNYRNYYRLRVGNYRVIYSLEKARLLILIIRIGHRKEVY
ncbi:MAG: type II toxin-antitoxin system RelE/ParE family toxin [Candidatus Marinimicrobia bacterium]|nr:type II toxin-antitoxin system RelE/ParE family toxin [Candidatus Neomarinimicrobiota bacterium]MDD5710099.1 type II toxin-antitoxin system RelE/ParE family toxin [Candidatus Neomarinimicrobiota bacterium]